MSSHNDNVMSHDKQDMFYNKSFLDSAGFNNVQAILPAQFLQNT